MLDAQSVGPILTDKSGAIAPGRGEDIGTSILPVGQPNGVPTIADVQGTPRDTYFKQSARITGLDM